MNKEITLRDRGIYMDVCVNEILFKHAQCHGDSFVFPSNAFSLSYDNAHS